MVKCLHTLFARHATVVEVSLGRLREEDPDREGFAVYLTHDLSMLRLIEAFSESAPQLVLMLTTILRQSQFDCVTGARKKHNKKKKNPVRNDLAVHPEC